MSEWQPITTYPEAPIGVLYYWARTEWRDFTTNEVIHIPEIEGVRFGVGYWDGKAWCESGTNHEVFEFVEPGDDDKPTHWMPLPAPPIDSRVNVEEGGAL